ncbi:MAG: hypothetical protein ACRDL7_05705, partial [Gaiellaceae bacterium]
ICAYLSTMEFSIDRNSARSKSFMAKQNTHARKTYGRTFQLHMFFTMKSKQFILCLNCQAKMEEQFVSTY